MLSTCNLVFLSLHSTYTKGDAQLQEIEEEVKHMREKIDSVKAQILQNDDTVSKLLNMVVQPGY